MARPRSSSPRTARPLDLLIEEVSSSWVGRLSKPAVDSIVGNAKLWIRQLDPDRPSPPTILEIKGDGKKTLSTGRLVVFGSAAEPSCSASGLARSARSPLVGGLGAG